MSIIDRHTPQVIAIPRYGQRMMSRFGLARGFYLVTRNLQTDQNCGDHE